MLHFGRICDWITASLLGAGVRLEGLSIVDGYRIVLSLLLTDKAANVNSYWSGLLKKHGVWRDPHEETSSPSAGGALYQEQRTGSAKGGKQRVRISGGDIQDPVAFKEMWRRQGMVADA